MAKFSPGDPVWLRAVNIPGREPNHIAPGEYSAVISPCTAPYWAEPYGVGPIYVLDVQAFDLCIAREEFIRPRRDDYQQHQALGSKKQLEQILKQPLFIPTVSSPAYKQTEPA